MIGADQSHPRLDAQKWVRLVRNPSVHIYQALRTTMEQSSVLWLRAFLELGGLDLLVSTLERLAAAKHDFSSFSDAILQLDCVACVRELLNTDIGMRWMVDNRGLVRKLVKGLNTHSPLTKKHMFELLTAICVYSLQGYTQLLDAFESNKREWVHPSRFSVILSELDDADTIGYRTTLMGLINAIINSCHDNKERNALRNEFISLQLLDILHQLRKEDKDAELAVQIQVFMEQKHSDEKLLSKSVDVNSHHDLFQGIYHKIMGSPESMQFLSVLQDLLWMHSTELQSPCKWELIAKVVHQVACLSSEADVDQYSDILNTLSLKNPPKVADDASPGTDLQDVLDSTLREDIVAGAPGMDSGISMNSDGSGFQRQGSGRRSGHRSAPLARVTEEAPKKNPEGPAPSLSMQKLKWVKLTEKVAKRDMSMWSQDSSISLSLDFDSLEDQFPENHGIRDADDEVQLLSAEQSLSLNLMLSRVEQSAEELAELIEAGDDMELGVATLEYIMSCLPSEEEVWQLRAYEGERFDLGQAEQFLMMLSDIPDYHVLLETMTFRARLRRKFEHLKGMLVAQIGTCGDILHSKGLKSFLNLVLQAGNFLNDKSIFSGAPGFQLISLERLCEVKSGDPWTDLLTHLVRVTHAQNSSALAFAKSWPNLNRAASVSFVELKAQVAELNEQFHKLRKRVYMAVPAMKPKLDKIMEDSKKDLKYLQDKVQQASGYSHQMSIYFCEDEDKFDLQTCLTQLSYFCDAINKILKEQSLVKHQCELAQKRRTELEKKCNDAKCATEFGDRAVACSSFMRPHNERIVEDLLTQVHSGKITPLQIDDDLATPSSDENPLLISNIMASTPARCLDGPVRSMERLDATAVNHLIRDSLLLDSSMKGFGGMPGIKLFPKVEQLQKTHRRTNSDLDRSVDPAQKWCVYQKTREPAATDRQPDSRCPLASLGLEQMGRTLSVEDINFLQAKAATRLPEDEPKEKTKKRSSLGFFRRLSRRVLRTRNSDSGSDKSEGKESPPLRKSGRLRNSGRKSGSKNAVVAENKANEQRANTRAKGFPEAAKYGRKAKVIQPRTLSLENKENAENNSMYENIIIGSEV